jgi:hypothetical protein
MDGRRVESPMSTIDGQNSPGQHPSKTSLQQSMDRRRAAQALNRCTAALDRLVKRALILASRDVARARFLCCTYHIGVNFDALDLRVVCFHEAGHTVLANCYGLAAEFSVERVGKPTMTRLAWRGQTSLRTSRATPYQKAVIGWAGALAEALMDKAPEKWPESIDAVAPNVLEDYYAEEPNLSESDRVHIEGTKQFKRAFNRACRLIVKHSAEIAELAEKMTDMYSQPSATDAGK